MPEPSADPDLPTKKAFVFWRAVAVVSLLVALIGLAGAIAWSLRPVPEPEPAAQPSFPLPTLSTSPYRNTSPEARYIGSKACYRCHTDESDSYRETGMGKSMAPVAADGEPPDGAVDHSLSGRRYKIYRKAGQMHHRELLQVPGREEVVLADFPVKYVVGSGLHSRTYLVEVNGFLVESPVTWYNGSRPRWDMSPGYNKPDQLGFERLVTSGCLMCHAGRTEEVGGSPQRFLFHEHAVGCERCHGPGSLHLERQNHPEPAPRAAGQVDDTIVNPKRLSRELAEAVCEQCHLQGTAMLPVRGRRFEDFRPGLQLQDFRLDYQVSLPETQMTVTGHVQQLHLSRCYQESTDLTCLTCHNPHAFPKEEERVAYYRGVCQSCHEQRRPCKDVAARDPKNGCVKCHMPTSPTEVPHLAFTHHRIGLHPDRKQPSLDPSERSDDDLVQPFHNLSRLGAIDRERSLGIAYLQLGSVQHDPHRRESFRSQGVLLLSRAKTAGLDDALVDSNLCRLSFGQEPGHVVSQARQALAHTDLPALDRCDVLYILADAYSRQGKYDDAIAVLHDLNRLRRHAPYWLLLGRCQEARGNRDEAMKAYEEAVAINPTLGQVRQQLASCYRAKGDQARADYHERRVGIRIAEH
jgi:hypothetical protein